MNLREKFKTISTKKNFKKNNIISVIVVISIVTMLVLSSPVVAVTLGVTTSKTIYGTSDNSVTFEVYVDISSGERVPVRNLTLNITNSSGIIIEKCVFYPNGTAISGCTNMTITKIAQVGYGYGYQYAHGYGYNTTWQTANETFGSGYGYGYTSGYNFTNDGTAELHYNVTWNLTAANPSDGNYTADLEAFAQQNTTWYVFTTTNDQDRTIQIDTTAPTYTLSSPSSNSTVTYTSLNQSHYFNATIIDAVTGVDTVTFYLSYTNYTANHTGNVYWVNLTGLSTGEYLFRWYMNDSAGNANSSDYYEYNIRTSEQGSPGGGGSIIVGKDETNEPLPPSDGGEAEIPSNVPPISDIIKDITEGNADKAVGTLVDEIAKTLFGEDANPFGTVKTMAFWITTIVLVIGNAISGAVRKKKIKWKYLAVILVVLFFLITLFLP